MKDRNSIINSPGAETEYAMPTWSHCYWCPGSLRHQAISSGKYVENMFENFSRHHEHETRQSLILEEPMVNTASGENCLRYILPRIVNNTNPIIINMVDSYSFEGFVRSKKLLDRPLRRLLCYSELLYL